MPSQKKMLPRPVAFTVLAVLAVGVSFGVANVVSASKKSHAAEKAAMTSAADAPPASAVPAPKAEPAK